MYQYMGGCVMKMSSVSGSLDGCGIIVIEVDRSKSMNMPYEYKYQWVGVSSLKRVVIEVDGR